MRLSLFDLWLQMRQQLQIHCHFHLGTGVELSDAPKLKLTFGESRLWPREWDHAGPLGCHSVLEAVYGLTGSLRCKEQRTNWTSKITNPNWLQVRQIKRITCKFIGTRGTVEQFGSTFKMEQTHRQDATLGSVRGQFKISKAVLSLMFHRFY